MADSSHDIAHPARADSSSPTRNDRIRQVAVSISAGIAIVGALIGSGALGGESMPEAAGGAFAADATPVAPGGPAFAIWSIIYAGLIAYAVWQWGPRQTVADRHRRVGGWVAASMLLNAAWLLAVQAGLLWLTLVIMALLLIVLVVAFITVRRTAPAGVIDAIVTDGTVGLYLGWIVVATAANAAAVLARTLPQGSIGAVDAWAVAVLAVAGVIGVLLALWDGGRFAPSAAICWGLAWVGAERLTGDLVSVPAAIAAFVAAAVVLIVTIGARLLSTRPLGVPGVGSRVSGS